MKNNLFKSAIYILACSLALVSCKDDEKPNEPAIIETDNTAYICNEGNFGTENGDLSVYSLDSMRLSNNVFQVANNEEGAGNVLQSIAFNGTKSYFVLNASAKIEVTNENYERIATITGSEISYPRYAIGYGKNVFVTNGRDAGSVVIIDTEKDQIINSISIGTAPNRIISANNKIYAVNTGGFASDTNNIPNGSLSVINPVTLTETKQTELHPRTVDLVAHNGFVYTLSEGATVYNTDYTEILKSTPAYICKLDLDGNLIEEYEMPSEISGQSFLEVMDNEFYLYSGGNVYHLMNMMPHHTVVSGVYAYGFNAGKNSLWLCDAGDFSGNGTVYQYNTDGELQNTLSVGIIPNGVYFK